MTQGGIGSEQAVVALAECATLPAAKRHWTLRTEREIKELPENPKGWILQSANAYLFPLPLAPEDPMPMGSGPVEPQPVKRVVTLHEQKKAQALQAKPGDRWKNRHTQRVVEVVSAGVTMRVRHQDGRITNSHHNSFALNYDPMARAPKKGEVAGKDL
jgi:hypothetical protein